MELAQLTRFFMWMTIIGGGLLMFATVFTVFAADLTYRIQNYFFPLPRETYNVVMYSFLGVMKIAVIFLGLAPWLALLAMG